MGRRLRRSDPVDPVLPVSFSAGYGAGVKRGLCLGGGGLFFVAWQVAYLQALAADGIDVVTADRVVGTSAGSVVATALTGGKLKRVHRELMTLTKVPGLVSRLAPVADLSPSQQRAVEQFRVAPDGDPATIRAIGHAALAAAGQKPGALARNISLLLGVRDWPTSALRISCVDAYSGERCIVTDNTGVSAPTAAAASSAVPGIFRPVSIGDRQCMDGGVSGSGTHLDVLGGAQRVLVLALTDGSKLDEGMMTTAPGAILKEVADLEETGARVELRTPENIDLEALMSPGAIPDALAMGTRQGTADGRALGSFWT